MAARAGGSRTRPRVRARTARERRRHPYGEIRRMGRHACRWRAFSLTAKADRIEVDAQGEASVFDYKTGDPPSKPQVLAGWSPQLTLEAAMIEAGAFPEIGARPVAGAAYVGLKNGGKTQQLSWKEISFSDVVAKHSGELVRMLSQYRDPATPYPSRPYVAFVRHEGDYDHLARVKEWARGGGDDA
ncbi:PD-(D/E)XK nuclease family protein [Methylocystis sp. IM4]|uniref:PD-(D/E)XK nuclease family protein n=1 Tax=Methylocystis sp. IM4 TaxID=3136560 RepID=UPI0031192284